MNDYFSIKNHVVHLWRVRLNDFFSEVEVLEALLDETEKKRAARFKFDIHQKRFIIAKSILRKVLSLYLKMPAEEIIFHTNAHGKPFVENSTIQFNVSHSEDLAVFAVTSQQAIGVDIEKIETQFDEQVAKRFFSEQEYTHLITRKLAEQAKTFYALWSMKEAVIKLKGEGLYRPLSSFSVTEENPDYLLKIFYVDPHFAAAFAAEKAISELHFFEWEKAGFVSFSSGYF